MARSLAAKLIIGMSVLLLTAGGCPLTDGDVAGEQSVAPVITNAAVNGQLVEGELGKVTVGCLASDPDGTVVAVTADLTAIGGSAAQALSL